MEEEHERQIDEIIKSVSRNYDPASSNMKVYLTKMQQQVKEILAKYSIKMNRQKAKTEAVKGYNLCKDNAHAYFDFKKRCLFPDHETLDSKERDDYRNELIEEYRYNVKK